MAEIGVILNGVTGRMGTNQHLLRSIVAIMEQGGVALTDGSRVMPRPVLVGRNPDKLKLLSEKAFGASWTTSLDEALSDPNNEVYFDAQTTLRRVESVKQAIAAGKHVYCEKPTAVTTEEAYDLYLEADRAGVKHGVVQDKLWLPGMLKIKALSEASAGLAQKLYAEQVETADAAAPDSGSDDENVVDAEFEEVKDDDDDEQKSA